MTEEGSLNVEHSPRVITVRFPSDSVTGTTSFMFFTSNMPFFFSTQKIADLQYDLTHHYTINVNEVQMRIINLSITVKDFKEKLDAANLRVRVLIVLTHVL